MENMLEFWRCFVFWISAFLCLLIHARTSSYGKLCVGGSPLSMATFHPSSENYAHALCHSTANHRLVLDPVGIGFTILLRLSLTPSLQEFEARHSHSILESYSEYHRQGLDFPDSHECRHQFWLIPRRFWLRNLRDPHSIVYRTEVVVRHTFMIWGRWWVSQIITSITVKREWTS